MIIFISDLDNTLIYSKNRLNGNKIPIEDFKEPSYMLTSVIHKLKKINNDILFIPVTTRSIAQYSRINLSDIKPKIAFCSHAGNMIINGEISKEYRDSIVIRESINQISQCVEYLKKRDFDIRFVDDLFYFMKTEDNDIVKYLKDNIDTNLLDIEISAKKLYIFPKNLNKSLAINKVRNMYKEATIIAAGDSILDIPMLEKADISITLEESACKNSIICKQGNFSEFTTDVVLDLISPPCKV